MIFCDTVFHIIYVTCSSKGKAHTETRIEAVIHLLLDQWERINEFFVQSAREFISSIRILVSETKENRFTTGLMAPECGLSI